MQPGNLHASWLREYCDFLPHVLLLALWWNHTQNVVQIYFRLKWQKHSFLGFPGTRKIYKLHCIASATLFGPLTVVLLPNKKEEKKNFFSASDLHSSAQGICGMLKKRENRGCNYPVPSASSEMRSFAIDFQEIRFHFSPKVTNAQKHPCWQARWKTY